MNLEDELREALRREAAPAGFAANVLAKTQARQNAAWWRRPATLALAAGLTVAAIVPSAILYRQREERRRGIEARDQLLTALKITNMRLREANARIQRNTRHI